MKSNFTKQQRREIIRIAKSILHTYLRPSMFRAMRYTIKYHFGYGRTYFE